MNIEEKLEAIRMQPEHVRLRWVWGSVIFSMLIIFILWIFSITTMFKGSSVPQVGDLNLLPPQPIVSDGATIKTEGLNTNDSSQSTPTNSISDLNLSK